VVVVPSLRVVILSAAQNPRHPDNVPDGSRMTTAGSVTEITRAEKIAR
jgi:hypothetical protein